MLIEIVHTKTEALNIIEHALFDGDISIEDYEKLHREISKMEDGQRFALSYHPR